MLRQGALMMVIATLLFGVVATLVKMGSASIPSAMVVFFRNIFGLLALMPLVFRHGWQDLKTQHFLRHVSRSLLGLAAMYCSFYAVAHMPLADATLLHNTSPLFMAVLAQFLLKERIPRGMPWILALGFAGVVLVLKPGFGLFRIVALVALTSGFLAGAAQVDIRRLTMTEPTVRIVFYFGLIATVISFFPAARVWQNPTPEIWGLMAAMGVCATVAQLFLTRAHRLAPSAQVGPFIYTSVVFAGILDWIFWKNLPDAFFLAGALFVVSAGVLVIRKIESAAQAQAVPVKQ